MEQLIRPLVFVCHNREDKPTAERIAKEIIKAGHEAFFDKWDIRPGDSFIKKISRGISEASYLLVLLSMDSVQSNWVKKELEIALTRQIKDKHIKVIPCLLEDCDIPVFLEPIAYADFRSSFEDGIAELLPAIEKVDAVASGRLKKGEEAWIHDWAIDRALPDPTTGVFSIKFVLLSWYGTEEFSCYYFIDCIAGSRLRERLEQYPEHLYYGMYIFFLSTIKIEIEKTIEKTDRDFGVWLPDAEEHKITLRLIEYESKESILDIEMRARRLGNLGKKATMLYIGELMTELLDKDLKGLSSRMPKSAKEELVAWMKSNPWDGKIKAERHFEEIF